MNTQIPLMRGRTYFFVFSVVPIYMFVPYVAEKLYYTFWHLFCYSSSFNFPLMKIFSSTQTEPPQSCVELEG